MNVCPACGSSLAASLAEWHLECPRCYYEASVLQPRILEQRPGGDLDEVAREDALEPLRRHNFAELAGAIAGRFPPRDGEPEPSLLDVGCAHGWFLETMRTRFQVQGIEPDRDVAHATARRGLPVREGFFPDVLLPEERFDVIVFNDVLEHIPDVHAVIDACRRHLKPDGVLVVNAPSRTGVLYRLAKLMARMGRPASFERMWQKGFPSPHVHYFDDASVRSIAQRHGFRLESACALRSVSAHGLLERIRYSRDVSPVKAVAIAAAVTLMVPVLPLLPPDIRVWMLAPTTAA